ncbi:MAG: hypothetical protein KTR25_06860, partial [Myxococcales bacterium]|nr:hypothetical protein [Myxococcales bacterium]
LLGHIPPGTLASSSERFTKSWARQLHTWPNQQATRCGVSCRDCTHLQTVVCTAEIPWVEPRFQLRSGAMPRFAPPC